VSFSLYVHIPYCESKCPYCDFNSYAAESWPEREYTQALIAELRRRIEQAPWAGESIKTIFFGGGTPSLFAPRSIGAIIGEAARLCAVEPGAEITLEANPGTVDAAKLAGMRDAGVNRISFGAQSFNPDILRFLGRIHDPEDTREAVRMAHQSGFERLNLDLMFAIPGQTLDGVRSDIASAAALGPDHISAYNLTFEDGTAFSADLRRGRIRACDSDQQAIMYAAAREQLAAIGYPIYEISNYAPEGHEARHNLTYWRGESYLGLGAGAHSFARSGPGGRRWWNERGPAPYINRATLDGTAEAGSEIVDGSAAAGEFVFLNLRLRSGFALGDFERRFGQSFDAVFGERAAPLFESRLLIRDGDRIRLSDRGLELADSIFAEFV